LSSIASDLVKDLRIFGQMAANTWADGKPIRSSLSLDSIGSDLSPSELQMRLLMFATNISHTNESASAWLEMAHWCYERGQSEVKSTKTEAKRVLEASSSEYISTSILNSLTMEERGSLIDLIPPEVFKEVPLIDKRIVAKIYVFLDKISDESRSCRYCVEDIQNPDATSSGLLMDIFMEYLAEETSLIDDSMTFNSRLLSECSSLAAALTSRLHTLQSISAQAYFTFLAVAGRKFVAGGSSQEKIRPLDSTRAALRLLSLLNEPSRALRNTVADLITHGITKNSNSFISDSVDSHTSSIVWAECLPQILDRLGHPDPVVRECLLVLLNRLIHAATKEAKATSNSDRVLAKKLVYPALVGCRGVDYVKVEAKVESHLKLVEALVDAGYSTMVNEVSSLIDEMRRITVLWDELWFGILTQHLDDFDKRLIALEQKTEGEKENLANSVDDILKLRCEALLAPTFSIFEQLCALTLDTSAETPYELWFQNTYREHIDKTLQILRNFCTEQPPDDYRKLLEPIKDLYKRFQMLNQLPVKKAEGGDQKMSVRDNQENENEEVEEGKLEGLEGKEEEEEKEKERKVVRMNISNRLLNLAEISPTLLTMNCNSSIPLPGRARTNLVHIAPEIRVYPTKTRPKYLTFFNDRGQAMPYLLKCLEDLRLDERIMGLLRLTNTAFSLDGQPNAYTTPTYSITPIGPKAGLIQMVQAAVPLFKLYKKWQERIALDMAIDNVGGRPLEFIAKAKPSDLFYRKLRDHLPAHLANLNSRHLWPKEILVKILNELEMQIPDDLMTRELWAASSSMSAWWRIHRTYATSLGVTSAFGYLIGLGDRHLDNLLVDLSTGRIVHIDFNVCFDEGRSLKVPELVPFRFTRILRHALGPFSMYNSGKVGGTFGSSFVETLRTCRSIQELFHMHLQSFGIDPLNNWMSASQSGVSWSAFDLAYFAAFRGGCLPPLASESQNQMTKKRRVQTRLNVEVERTIGLMIARMVELGIKEPSWQTEVNSLLNMLVDNLKVLSDFQEKQTEIDRITRQLAILSSNSEGYEQLVAFEHHCHGVESAKEEIKSALERVESFATCLEANIVRDLDILNDWLSQPSSSSSGDLSHLLDEYRNFAQICMLSSDSKFHFNRDNTIRFSNKREVASALRQAILSPNILTAFKQLYRQTVTPQVDNFFSTSLHNALTVTESNLRTLKEQHFIPSTFDRNGLRSLFDQSHENLVRFIHQNSCRNIQVAYSLSLVRNLITWITSMFVMEPLVHIDVLYQHTGAIECAISVLDPTGSGNGLPFWAGNEIDTNSELQFFSTVHALIGKVVDLRDSLCFGFLPSMESALRTASRSDLLLLDRIREVINSTDSALQLQQAMNVVVMGDSKSPLAEVFKQIHVTLLTVAIEMENTCQSLANYPINATSWSRVDWITQAIAPLQSRCTADVGATSLWGWRPSNGPCELTTWLDEVYRAGILTIFKVTNEISSIWTDVREGRQRSTISCVPYVTVLERDFINRLSDRLVLVSEALLASSRVLLALFESLGISVQQELLQQTNLMPVMGVAPSVSVLRLHQMAETYAGINPDVLILASAIDNQLVNVFNATNSHVYTLLVSREIEANEVQLSLLQSACQAFDWMHDYADHSDSSLRSYLKRLKTCVENKMKTGENADPEIKSLCEIGLAICAAEHSRLGDDDDLDNAVLLLNDYTSFCRKLGQCEKEFTELDTVLYDLKNQFNLSWPATDWPNMEWVIEKLSSRITEIKQELQIYENGIDSAISTLVEENLVGANKDDYGSLIRALLAFEKQFLTELSPYVKQLERFSQISSDQECGSIWKQWLENCEIWKTTSSQVVKDLTELTSGYFLENKNKIMITGFLSVLRNCLQLRDHLGPSFKMLLEKGILKVLKRSKSTAIISIIEKLALVNNVKVEDYFEVADSRPLPREVVSPQALLAMRRLFGRLQGVDEYLLPQNDEASSSTVLSFIDQAHLCIRAAMDPNNLALMFEGWTPWV
uniref:Non-specific serine/threonine protein kinase n=1 Tax=Rodentolepis nana TaxID=102285 RepID=A0A0R3T4W9_RODNA